MLNFNVRRLLKRERLTRPMSAERRLSYGVDSRQPPRVKKSLFGFIFAEDIASKEDVPLRVLHSSSPTAQYVNKWGCWVEPLSPQFRRFFYQWFVLGKTNPTPIHKVQKRYKVVKQRS